MYRYLDLRLCYILKQICIFYCDTTWNIITFEERVSKGQNDFLKIKLTNKNKNKTNTACASSLALNTFASANACAHVYVKSSKQNRGLTNVIIYMQIFTQNSSNEMTLWKGTKTTLTHEIRTFFCEYLINAIMSLGGRSAGWWMCCCFRMNTGLEHLFYSLLHFLSSLFASWSQRKDFLKVKDIQGLISINVQYLLYSY